MIKLSYNLTPSVQESLQRIENLRRQILLTPVAAKTLLRLRWETNLNRIFYSLYLCDNSLSRSELIKLLTCQQKKELTEKEKKVFYYKNALDYINQNWLVSKREVSLNAIKTIKEISKATGNLDLYGDSLKYILEYIQAGNEHPVVKAAILQIQIFQRVLGDETDWRLITLCGLLILYKYGYDFAGLIVWEEYFYRDRELIKKIKQKAASQGNLTVWLEYSCQTMVEHLERINRNLSELGYQTEIPSSFWELNERQKEILTILNQPDLTINNRNVQKIFKISQITASRDLTKLTQLGLLYPHGKGRSVYYTKV